MKKFKINFGQFKSIFIRDPPKFFYDIVSYAGLVSFDHIEYPYNPKGFLKESGMEISNRK